MKPIIFIDTEVSETDNKAYDFGAVNEKALRKNFCKIINCNKKRY